MTKDQLNQIILKDYDYWLNELKWCKYDDSKSLLKGAARACRVLYKRNNNDNSAIEKIDKKYE
jgi:hypothetical protein